MGYDWPKRYEEKVTKFADEKGLKGKQREKFIDLAYEKFNECRVPIYEPAGLLAAHSMGEPATQLILRTKHYAGAAEVSIGSEIERLEGLVDARSKTKYPIMTIYIKKEMPKDDKALLKYLKEIIFRRLSDVCDIKEDLDGKKISIKYNKDLMKENDVSPDLVKERVKAVMKGKTKETDSGVDFSFDDASLITIRKYMMKLTELSIKGIEGIKDAIIVEENGEKVIKTQGTNFKSVVVLEFVDPVRTYTNDIFETHKVLGIEAARNLLVQELHSVYSSASIGIDLRHILLLADTMCYDGTVKGVVRTGIVSTKASPLARAAFEQTEKVVFDAAFDHEVEKFIGVVENVMAGLPITVGVGNIDLTMDFKDLPKEAYKHEPKKEKKVLVKKEELIEEQKDEVKEKKHESKEKKSEHKTEKETKKEKVVKKK